MSWPIRLAAALALAFICGAAQAAVAQPGGSQAAAARPVVSPSERSVSYSAWTINGPTVHLRFILPASEARNLAPAGQTAVSAAVAIGSQVAVTAGGTDCAVIDQGEGAGQIYTLALTPGLNRFEIIFSCPQADGLVLSDHVLFGRVPGHVNFARIQREGGPPTLQMFTRDHQSVTLPQAGGKLAGAGADRFARQGMSGMVGQIERLGLLAGLLLVARRWRDLGVLAGALALGYLASIAVALSGLVTADPGLSEAAVGFLCTVLGVCALRLEAGGSTTSRAWIIATSLGAGVIGAGFLAIAALKGASVGLAASGLLLFGLVLAWIAGARPGLRWLMFAPAAVFGLLDGAALAGDLSALQLPPLQLWPAFLGYDLGALATGVALIGVGMALLWLLARWLRPLRNGAADLAAAGLTGVGLFWFVSHLYS